MRIRNLISEGMEVVSLPPTATALDATKLMVDSHRGSVLVVGDAGELLGIFTERDLMVRVVSKDFTPSEMALREVMTTDLFTTGPDHKASEVRREMRERHIRHLPVLEGGSVIAVLSMRDLMRADLERTRNDADAMRDYIQGEG
jgi:CBS domain-containing protein